MTSETVTIRPAAVGDVATLAVLSAQLGYPVPPADLLPRLETVLAKPGHSLLVAESGGQVVGWIHGVMRYLLEEPPHAFIGGLVVADGHRSRGIGAKLMAAIEEWAVKQGGGEVHVYSNVTRERAHLFYERIGYKHTKTSKVLKKTIG